MKAVRLSIICIAALSMAVLAQAQTAEEVIAKSLEVQGGVAAMKAINTAVAKGTISIVQMGIELPFTRYQKRPNKTYTESDFQGMKIIQACDGTTAWMLNPFMGSEDPQEMPEDMAAYTLRDADFDGPFVDMKQKGHTVELVGKETIDGKECFNLKLTYKDGFSTFLYFDAATYLPIMTKGEAPSGVGGSAEVITKLSDYRKVGTFTIPFKIEQNFGGQEMVIQITDYKMDESIDDALFVMPVKKTEVKQEEKP
jgi:outer membrane lipoprotein-sorting protein